MGVRVEGVDDSQWSMQLPLRGRVRIGMEWSKVGL
jgi:hypothetical protein